MMKFCNLNLFKIQIHINFKECSPVSHGYIPFKFLESKAFLSLKSLIEGGFLFATFSLSSCKSPSKLLLKACLHPPLSRIYLQLSPL